MGRQNISTGGPWEAKLGYSRAVPVVASISVSGSTAMTLSGLVGTVDPCAQTIQTLKTIEAALQQAGPSLAEIVRTRMYLTTSVQVQVVCGAQGRYVGVTGPAPPVSAAAAPMVAVPGLGAHCWPTRT